MSEKSRLVQDLIVLAAEERIAELVVSEAGRTIRVLRGAASGQPPAGEPERADSPEQPSPAAAGAYTITAPLTGTFYRAARPGAQPLAAHAPVCVIEAMKMMTEVSAERAGAVLRVLCEDGQAVEQGQPLLVIQPDEPRHVP
ncbi:acetyl-CoA carboxylase biotin carboxyl carrier protein subunit [Bordetella bronchiseptica]|uniref:acetyl-CoA carboxylase biotin carboxyl carrier protein n=1 Tax=Bordetella bronchiseptica TaxID=518 RepID=UPI003EDBD305